MGTGGTREGSFDFSILDHWIDVARQQKLHLVLLWFGSWKNAFSEYAPNWVKSDTKRFPRAMASDGTPLEILSTFGTESAKCDSRAFGALLKHVRIKDGEQQTVLMVQVENESEFWDRKEIARRKRIGNCGDCSTRIGAEIGGKPAGTFSGTCHTIQSSGQIVARRFR